MTRNIAVITGASSGIGAVYAERLAGRGFDLLLVARDEPKLEALAQRLGTAYPVSVQTQQLDLRQATAEQIHALFEDAAVSLLINNAGIAGADALFAATDTLLDAIVDINVHAACRVAAAAARSFTARKRGSIVNIASVVALMPEQFEPVYVASKAFMLALSESMAVNCAAHGVHVQAVLPGIVRTAIWERSGHGLEGIPPGMVMEAEDLVDAALRGLDLGERVSIPSLPDPALWQALLDARQQLQPLLSLREPAARYR